MTLQCASDKEDTRAESEQHELASDISGENAVEERDTRHDQSGELERPREQIHATYGAGDSAIETRVMRSPCSILSTTSCPATT